MVLLFAPREVTVVAASPDGKMAMVIKVVSLLLCLLIFLLPGAISMVVAKMGRPSFLESQILAIVAGTMD
jgi:hypothetical protein